ncbi:1-deoxy-D-xylulose-5-phosphate synthase [Enterococcus sp. JM4C]|uniref:1-deoxy-D-xylulose-5-phosphate synthase n=1 Tax=Candidatus Enterococcus huntleyi TaxID=1857217 RepID=UPI001379E9DE|nr:1-deoxy-D-xylulose-5-phosphate synthase [Enterococcus sp. JM4C]KAF1296745.1 1-deoxy-D-xylulose-5-phosphate synthase [Enterococcus sp. JM4C]
MYLQTINKPEDLKRLTRNELHQLVEEVRTTLLEKISSHGGHNGPNLGVVEMTIALHYVFESPIDKLIFDVSHQTYIHKMLTGRAHAFLDANQYDEVSGYTNPKESDHDLFTVGHTSTSLSLANGVAKARDIKGETNNVVAVIGDGSLSGGLAYEGLNNISELGTNTIVIVNDNDQSIAENHGGIYKNLRLLRETQGQAESNFFTALGFQYEYLAAGNDLDALIELFTKVKDSSSPVVLHIQTVKGKGFSFAEENREKFHAGGPFSLETGEYLARNTATKDSASKKTYNQLTTELLLDKMARDEKVVAVNAGTPMLLFNAEQREKVGKQFVDVGIAEEQAATMTAGMAKNGVKPVWAVHSTFMQRSYDQISHDLALNNLAGTILVYGASVSAMNDESHLGIFDIPFLSHIPNLVYLAPTSKEEYLALLEWSLDQNAHPVAIRVPVGSVEENPINEPINEQTVFKNQLTKKGERVAIIGVGNFHSLAKEVANHLEQAGKLKATVINPRVISQLDTELLETLKETHELVVTLEDGILSGGYGQTIASYYGDSDIHVQNYGLGKVFYDRYQVQELLAENSLTVEQISENILKSSALN